MDQKEFEDFLVGLRGKLREVIMPYFGNSTISRKGEGVNDVFTQADLAAQDVFASAIKKQFPDHGIIAEEQSENYKPESPYQWFIDPIDGTRNFATGVPLFGSMTALVSGGNVEVSMSYLPVTDEMYLAKRNGGVTKNGIPVLCGHPKDFKSSYGIGPIRSGTENIIKFQKAIMEIEPAGVWMNSIASLAVSSSYLADGRRDWFYSKGSKSWDYMASALIIKESGCVLLNADGGEWKVGDLSIFACTPELETTVRQIVEARKRYELE